MALRSRTRRLPRPARLETGLRSCAALICGPSAPWSAKIHHPLRFRGGFGGSCHGPTLSHASASAAGPVGNGTQELRCAHIRPFVAVECKNPTPVSLPGRGWSEVEGEIVRYGARLDVFQRTGAMSP